MRTLLYLFLLMSIGNTAWAAHSLEGSPFPDRSAAVGLNGASVSGQIYVFIAPESDVSKVVFSLNGTLHQTENIVPFDFAGTEKDLTAKPFDTNTLTDGAHTISAQVTLKSGATEQVSSTFEVQNDVPALVFSTSTVPLSGVENGSTAVSQVSLVATDGFAADFELSVSPASPWLSLSRDFTTTPSEITITADPAVSGVGSFSATVTATPISGTYLADEFLVTFVVTSGSYALLTSENASRTPSVPLGGQTTSGDIHVFVEPTNDIAAVRFFLNDPSMTGSPIQLEKKVPYDFAGTAPDGTAIPFSTLTLADGDHTITALIDHSIGDDIVLNATFTVANSVSNIVPSADFTFSCNLLSCDFDASSSSDPDGTIVDYFWNFGDGTTASGVTATHTFPASESYSVTLSVTDNGGLSASRTKAVSVSDGGDCSQISPLNCSQVRIEGDLLISFDGSDGGLGDSSGVGTGFTMVDPPSFPDNPSPVPAAPGYWPDKLTINSNQGLLLLETTAGIQYTNNNALDNALGLGLNVPSTSVLLKTTIVNLPATPPGGFAQAGLWFGSGDNFGLGTSEDNYIKAVVISPTTGSYRLQALQEENGVDIRDRVIDIPAGTSQIQLELFIDPGTRTVQARAELDGAYFGVIETFTDLPDEWFSFDQAGIDPTLSTRSFGGIFATHRKVGSPVVFSFDNFSVTEESASLEPGDFTFDTWAITGPSPTALTWGPDDRLYVTDIFGSIHAYTLDHATRSVLNHQVIDTIRTTHGGDRLTLGITTDPASTAEEVILWVSHSDGSLNNGQVNSGIVTRLSGPDFLDSEDVITGLPRAIANHAVNNIEFGPDGLLYIAAGGNTGAGAANLAPSEFGNRPEQPLSAAILVADVNNPAFEGQCATPIGSFVVPDTCDVAVYASGLRNSYDFVWHHNGSLYATDNGLGVVGTVPPVAAPPCTAYGDPNTDNPGKQADLLLLIEQGKYYGHPNPYREECVFKNGTFQNASPLPNYTLPLFTLGSNLSANGIIEYLGDSFYNKLMGQLLIANFSIGDNIQRVELSSGGTGVVSSGNLVGGFTDPLPLAQDPAGNIYVGEMSAGRITVLVPLPLDPAPAGAWTTRQSLPEAVLDAGGGSIGGKFYMVGGKNSADHISKMFIYDPVTDSWQTGPDLPGEAVENPAVAAFDDKLYVFGGSTGPFSGAVTNAAVFDAVSWTILPPMTTARGGAAVQVVDGKIYVIGGMDATGASLSSVEIYDPVSNSWTTGTPMLTRRDNPGAAIFDDVLYVFGGRTRNADGSVVDGTLASMELYDPTADIWTAGPSMNVPRRTMSVGTISGRAQVMGGENPVVAANEEYDPATNTWRFLTPMALPRHGAATATIYGSVFVAGGGDNAGSSFTDVIQSFSY